ncbi:MAG: tRNA (adenosine(37)-N6)-threonylcarbamoyltransferase complex transferase subunit TsaD [Chlorobi bacterium]|nr:tRNA (adenosine(37)-N6)-threonylcarbamoyltransferase complex transferase subunit TsaD [Chlorobiota bacterium]
MSVYILGIESSCDDTSAAVIKDNVLLSNITANQDVHKAYGGVVPELASRAHQQNIIPVVDLAIKKSGININQLNGIAFTRGPGLLGSLLVGTSFAKGFSLASKIKMIEVNHLQAHVLANFIMEKNAEKNKPEFPFLCLLVSGGHTQIILVEDYLKMTVLGTTLDDAAGEAFDKCAKIIGLPYPGGPHIDKLAKNGNKQAFAFTKPKIKDLDYSFSGLKTGFLYFVRDSVKDNPEFIKNNLEDLCSSIQHTIIEILLDKLKIAAQKTGISEIAIAGGVSANSELKNRLVEMSNENNWQVYIPKFEYTTDNAAMIAITGYFKYLEGIFASQDIAPKARFEI